MDASVIDTDYVIFVLFIYYYNIYSHFESAFIFELDFIFSVFTLV